MQLIIRDLIYRSPLNIKQGDKYLIGTGIIDNGKPKQGLVLADAPAQPWTFTPSPRRF